MKLCVLLTLVLTVCSQARPGESRAPQDAAGSNLASQEQQKGDDIARMLERVKSRSTAERREAIDQLAEAGDLLAVEPVIAALKDQEGEVRASAANALGHLGTNVQWNR
jgi:HEAT repeat protein